MNVNLLPVIKEEEDSIDSGKTNHSHIHTHLDDNMSNMSIAYEIIINALSAMLSLFYYFGHDATNIIILGKFNDPVLIGSFGLSMFFINSFSMSVVIGFLGGLETLCSNAFGAKKFGLVGRHFLIGRVITTLYYIIIVIPVFFCSFYILELIGIDYEICLNAAHFVKVMLISIFFNIQFLCMTRYLQSMNVFKPAMYISCCTIIFYPFICYYLTYTLNLKQNGIGISSAILNFANFILLQFYIIYFNPYPKSVISFSFSSILTTLKSKHLKSHLSIALPSTVMVTAEWVCFEASSLVASYLGSISLATNTCFINFMSNIIMPAIGLNISAMILSGNCVGHGSKSLIKRYVIITLMITLSLSLVLLCIIIVFRTQIVLFYTENDDVTAKFSFLIFLYYFIIIFDYLQYVLGGVLKGIGLQGYVAKMYLFMYYVVHIPLMLILVFKFSLGIYGIYISIGIVLFVLTISHLIKLYNLDLDKLIKSNKIML